MIGRVELAACRRAWAHGPLLALLALLAAQSVGACAGEPGGVGGVCEPGENIFCRCRGGDPGTKRCREDGQGFDQCYAAWGACEEALGPRSEGSSSSGEVGNGGKALLEACGSDSECDSGLCRMGYCTRECGKWQECSDEANGIYGDCVQIEGAVQQCVPYCGSQSDCELFGSGSSCGFALAVDAVAVSVCADWAAVSLPPDGSPCQDDWDCHLGWAGIERVCASGSCIGGCREQDDCPEGQSCSAGDPGTCF